LYNIPAELDGWKIRCTFSGPGGSVNSNGAKITVKGIPEPTPTPEPTPEPTPTPDPETEQEQEQESQHEHSFSQQWKYDADLHWQECDCGETTEKEFHSMQWTETVAATKKADGEEQGQCTVCGYTDSRVLEYDGQQQDSDRQQGSKLFKGIFIALIVIVLLIVVLLIIDKVQRERRRRRRRRRRR